MPHKRLLGILTRSREGWRQRATKENRIILFRCFIQSHCAFRVYKSKPSLAMQSAFINICERVGSLIWEWYCNRMPSFQQVSSWNFFPHRYFMISCKLCYCKLKCLGTTATQPQSGRPHKFTEWGRRMLSRIVLKCRQRSADSITADFKTFLGINTSAQKLCAGNFMAGFPWPSSCMEALLHWEQCQGSDGVVQWKCVLWSDKSHFSIWQSDARVWVWRMPGECYLPDCTSTVKVGGGGIMLWGSFSGVGYSL